MADRPLTEPEPDGIPWLIDGYARWLAEESVQVVEDKAVRLLEVETSPWERMDLDAVFIHAAGRGDLCSAIVMDIPRGGESVPVRHLYEAVYFVLDGQGSTVISRPDGSKSAFEWQRGSLFSVPLNARYRLLNASGLRRTRLVAVTNLPMVMKQFRNSGFVFGEATEFPERWPAEETFHGTGRLIETWEQRHMWETSVVSDLLAFDRLIASPSRGTGSANIQFVLGESTMHAHVSEVGVGQYKKAHIHGAGAHIVQLSGDGYSLYWFPGEEPRKVEWEFGLLHAPESGEWHQHFNVADTPSRYLAMSYGSYRYPFSAANRENILRKYSAKSRVQIEYEDEDSRIREMFDSERAKYLKARGDARERSV